MEVEFIPDFAVPSWKDLDFPVFDDEDEFIESRTEGRQDGGGGGVTMADVLFAKNEEQFLSGRNDEDEVLLAFGQEPEVADAGNGSRESDRTLSSSRV